MSHTGHPEMFPEPVILPSRRSGEVSMASKVISSRDDEETDGLTLDRDNELEQIRKAVKGIRFGEVRVIIQDGLIVQIERVEKQRIR
jgi:hypothetical protein